MVMFMNGVGYRSGWFITERYYHLLTSTMLDRFVLLIIRLYQLMSPAELLDGATRLIRFDKG